MHEEVCGGGGGGVGLAGQEEPERQDGVVAVRFELWAAARPAQRRALRAPAVQRRAVRRADRVAAPALHTGGNQSVTNRSTTYTSIVPSPIILV